MPENLNIVQVKDPILGKYSMILNNEQLKAIGKSGATNIEIADKQKTPSGRIRISPDSQSNHEDGFIKNDTDWSRFFPNEENAKIPELIEKAKKWENNFELAITSLTAFIGAGLKTYAGGGTTDFNIKNIIGPFADMYVINDPEEKENLQKTLNDINSMINK